MATTSTTASSMSAWALTLAILLAVAVSSPASANKTSAEHKSSEEAISKANGSAIAGRALFGFGPSSLFPNIPFANGFPFGGVSVGNPFLNGLPGGNNPAVGVPGGLVSGNPNTPNPGGLEGVPQGNGGFGGNPQGNGGFGGNPQGNGGFGGNPQGTGGFGGNPQGNGGFGGNPQGNGGFGGTPGRPSGPDSVQPRPDINGNQYNTGSTGRPFGSGEAPIGNQYNTGSTGRPGRPVGSGEALNGNQYNTGSTGRPFGSGEALNGNQYNTGSTGRPLGSGEALNGNQYNTGSTGRPTSSGSVGVPVSQGLNRPPVGTTAQPAFQRPNQPLGSTAQPAFQGQQGGEQLVNPEGCGVRNEDRIIGGKTTQVMELPWMVRLGYTSRRGGIDYRCGGSLINHRYVLTAAHCVGGDTNPVEVRLGEHDEDSDRDCSNVGGTTICAPPVVDVQIERVIRHPQYSSDSKSPNYLKNDVALLKLRSPVTFTEAVRPICLPQSGGVQVAGKKAIVAGWGKDRNRGSTGTRLLMKASVPLWTVPDCARVYQSRGVQVGQTQTCAGGSRGVDSCQGDSGGPLYRAGLVREQPRAVQVGIVSFGLSECATEGVPGVYTRVESFMPWIVSNMV